MFGQTFSLLKTMGLRHKLRTLYNQEAIFMNEFTGWEALTTFAGCAAVTGLITQSTKKLFSKLPTQWLSYIIAVIIMGLATIFTTGFSWSSIALVPINAIIVSTSANGGYSAMKQMIDKKKKKEKQTNLKE